MSWFNNLSSQPAIKLAAGYVAIIMALSLFFSVSLYQVSTSQLANSLRHQYTRLHGDWGDGPTILPRPIPIQEELVAGEHLLKLRLINLNLLILILGSAISYRLARRTLRPIEDALEAQSRFTADASHELRTPLAAMRTEIEVALRDKKLSAADAKAVLSSNLEEVTRLTALSSALLRLARQDKTEDATVTLDEIINEATKNLRKTAAGKKMTIKVQAEKIAVLGDKTSLVELLIIIIDNAIKYSDSGRTVEITAKSQDDIGIIEVKDEGKGIEASDLPHVFDRFYRADTARSKHKVEGHGLGLSIAQQIATMHGGKIEVESMSGKGSKFTIKLPLATPQATSQD